MRNSHLLSWLGQILLGLVILTGSTEVALTFWKSAPEIAAAAATVAFFGLWTLVRAELQDRPHRLLRKVRKALRFPAQWSVKLDKRVPQGGIIPVAVMRADGVRFVIDIQRHPECEWNTPQKEGEPLLVGPRGKPFKTDLAGPLLQAAAAWDATPVLWLPEAITPRNMRQEGVTLIVVMGSARELQHALRSAERVPGHRQATPGSPSLTSSPTRNPAAQPSDGNIGHEHLTA